MMNRKTSLSALSFFYISFSLFSLYHSLYSVKYSIINSFYNLMRNKNLLFYDI